MNSPSTPDELLIGVDVGSTTVKIAVLEPGVNKLLRHQYIRHNAEQAPRVRELLLNAHREFPDKNFRVALCGSGGGEIARSIGAFYVQEVVAAGLLVKEVYPEVKTAIELGGQDAKLILFKKEPGGNTVVNDMRMNGSCAGGTGAFIDQIAELLNISSEEFGAFAARGKELYDISGRCGVFAKTDIQPLLNQGIPHADIALSAFHAIAKQTIGGLAQGLNIHGPILFMGGPLTFNPTLVQVFKERLELSPGEVILPENSEISVACGAALCVQEMFGKFTNTYKRPNLDKLITHSPDADFPGGKPGVKNEEVFFSTPREREEFLHKYRLPDFTPYHARVSEDSEKNPQVLDVFLGVDGGSTTSKLVLINRRGEIIDKFYGGNEGEPLRIIRSALLDLRRRYAEQGITLNILSSGSTGYGEKLFQKAFDLDYSIVETVAHTRAAKEYCPEVSFILDIGGQDMKAIYVSRGIPVNFILNEACSAGCGSFLETYCSSLDVKVEDIAELAFSSTRPSRLGSRCTVFMNSSIITEQKNGRSQADIFSGLCYSVVENALTKVLRVPDFDSLGENILVQGGTFKNDAVLRAFQQKTGKNIIRPPHPGEMGALGVALLTKEHYERNVDTEGFEQKKFDWNNLENFAEEGRPASVCELCPNSCSRNIISFNNGKEYISGNRCEKGEILGDPREQATKIRIRELNQKIKSIPDLSEFREKLLVKDFEMEPLPAENGVTIGIPRTLEFWNSLPFWKTFFRSLGYKVVLSSSSTYQMFESGLGSVSSDTICLPAKVVHGHILNLFEQKPDRIFNPMLLKMIKENKNSDEAWMCPVIQGYSEIVRINDDPEGSQGIAYDNPPFLWEDQKVRDTQIIKYAREKLGVRKRFVRKAIKAGDRAQAQFFQILEDRGRQVLNQTREQGKFAVVLAGRPYHNDSFINHKLSKHFTGLGIPVLDLDCLPGLHDVDLSDLMIETNNTFHTRLIAAAMLAARTPHLELVQIVSFGCGHDAILSDEVERLMETFGGKPPLILKLDEGENRGPLSIRVRSFIETINNNVKKPVFS